MSPRLLLIPARQAIRGELPAALRNATVRIAVADGSSETLGRLVANIGYHFLIRRPVHDEMLRLWLQGMLFAGDDGRRHERHTAGWAVSLKLGWRRRPATLLDLSAGGARLLVRGALDPGTALELRIPRSAHHRRLVLPARVVRRRDHADDELASIALRFGTELELERLEAVRRGSTRPRSVLRSHRGERSSSVSRPGGRHVAGWQRQSASPSRARRPPLRSPIPSPSSAAAASGCVSRAR